MKKLVLFVTIVIAIFFSTSHTHADELDYQLPIEIQNIYLELDKASEIDENGFIYINMQEAERQKLSPQAIRVGLTINQLNNQISLAGVEATAKAAFRSAFFGFYGNYCGKGNKGWNVPPINDLDAACMMHDMCFKGFFDKNDECNKQFCRRLLPIIQVTPPSWKYTVAVAAYKLFS